MGALSAKRKELPRQMQAVTESQSLWSFFQNTAQPIDLAPDYEPHPYRHEA